MFDLCGLKGEAGIHTGNVTVMLAMLESIHDETCEDVVMSEFASTVGLAVRQLRQLQRLAYETMIEIETERRSGRALPRPAFGRPS